MTERALTFGSVARAYERFRPGYPSEVVDVVLYYAEQPVRTALEIGAGTGKATRAFTARDIEVTATEPDAQMRAEMRRTVPGAHCVPGTLEDLATETTYDLVLAAASLHWTDPTGRWGRIAELLGPGGVFTNVGGPFQLTNPDHEEALRAARAPYLEDDSYPEPVGPTGRSSLRWPGNEVELSPHFQDVREVTIPRRFDLGTVDFVGYLSTVSAYLPSPRSRAARPWARFELPCPTSSPSPPT